MADRVLHSLRRWNNEELAASCVPEEVVSNTTGMIDTFCRALGMTAGTSDAMRRSINGTVCAPVCLISDNDETPESLADVSCRRLDKATLVFYLSCHQFGDENHDDKNTKV